MSFFFLTNPRARVRREGRIMLLSTFPSLPLGKPYGSCSCTVPPGIADRRFILLYFDEVTKVKNG